MKKTILCIIASAVLFSTMEVALKTAGSNIDAFQLTCLRFFIGGLVLLPFAFRDIIKRGTVLDKGDYIYILLTGILCISISMVFFQLGVEGSNASTAAVVFCINPVFTLIFAHFLTDEKMNKNKIIALIVGIIGIVFMINPWNMDAGNTIPGACLTIAASITFGLYSALSRKSIQKLGGFTHTGLSILSGSIALLPILWITGKPVVEGITADNIGLVIYTGIMVSGMGYLFYFRAMERSDAATASVVFFLKPVFAPIIAIIVMNETIGYNGIAGIVLILLSSYINLREQKKKSQQLESKRYGGE